RVDRATPSAPIAALTCRFIRGMREESAMRPGRPCLDERLERFSPRGAGGGLGWCRGDCVVPGRPLRPGKEWTHPECRSWTLDQYHEGGGERPRTGGL